MTTEHKRLYRQPFVCYVLLLLTCELLIGCRSSPEVVTKLPGATGVTQDMKRSEAAVDFCYVDRIGATENPFSKGSVEVPRAEALTLLGWAVDPTARAAASAVDVVIDGVPYGARYGSERPDVAEHFKSPACRSSGVEFSMPASLLPAGAHRIMLRVVPQGHDVYYETPPLMLRIK